MIFTYSPPNTHTKGTSSPSFWTSKYTNHYILLSKSFEFVFKGTVFLQGGAERRKHNILSGKIKPFPKSSLNLLTYLSLLILSKVSIIHVKVTNVSLVFIIILQHFSQATKQSRVRWKSGKLKTNTPLLTWKSGKMFLQYWNLVQGWSYQPTTKVFVYLSDWIWYYSSTTKTCLT